jgi:hypothetical protein
VVVTVVAANSRQAGKRTELDWQVVSNCMAPDGDANSARREEGNCREAGRCGVQVRGCDFIAPLIELSRPRE